MGTPPTLESLAMQALVRSHSVSICDTLEDVPWLLFPRLFREAYAGGHAEVLKAMVQAWPFPCLLLGAVTRSPDLEALKAALDGLDLLLAQKDRPRRWKLQVLDLRSVSSEMRAQGCPSLAGSSPPGPLSPRPPATCDARRTEERPLTIVLDLTIQDGPQGAFQAYVLRWARKRRGRVQLRCEKLQILSGCTSRVRKALRPVRLDSIQELVVDCFWRRETMKTFARQLSQMQNLRVLHFSKMSAQVYTSRALNALYSRKYAAHLGRLQCLRELHVHDVFFLHGKLPAILGSLTALKTLSLSSCPLQEDDLKFLSGCACARQLQRLRLRSVCLGRFSPEPLRALLEQAAGTLETLALEDCGLTDAQLPAILPALRQCSQLGFFSFYGNPISLGSLCTLLSHTARLARFSQGIYPPPLESFYFQDDGVLGSIHLERFLLMLGPLLQAWRASSTPSQRFQICADFCHRRRKCQMVSLGPRGSWVLTVEGLPGLSALPA
ncbi:PRAME family member 12-like [Thomomys bottae]